MVNTRSPTFSNYPPPSPLTLFDDHEMADVIRRTTPDSTIIAHIAARMETTHMSGQDFLRLNTADLRTLSQDNEQVFQELRRLQRITLHEIPSFITPFFNNSGLPALFPDMIHSHRLSDDLSGGVNGMDNPQITESPDFHFDFSDDEDEPVNETSPHPHPPPPPSLVAVAVSQHQPDNLLQLDTSVNLTENVPPLTSPTPTGHGAAVESMTDTDEVLIHMLDDSSVGELEGENDPVPPDLSVHGYSTMFSTRSSSPALSYVDDEDPDAATQLSSGNIPNSHMPSDPNIPEQDRLPIIASLAADPPSQLIPDFLEASQLEHLLIHSPNRPQISTDTQEALEPSHLSASDPAVTLITPLPSLGSSLLNLSPSSKLHDLELQNPIDDTHLNVNEDINDQASEMPQNSNTESVDRDIYEVDQPESLNNDLRNSSTLDDNQKSTEACGSSLPSTSVLEPAALTGPHSVDADIQNTPTSTDKTLEDPISDANSDHDLDESDLEWLQDTEEQSNVSMDIPAISSSSAMILPIELIPVTPSDSPVFDGLDSYLTSLPDSQAPEVQNSAVYHHTPVRHEMSAGDRTLWPPSEATRRGLLSFRNGNDYSQSAFDSLGSTPESDTTDVASQSDPSRVQIHAQDSFLGTVSDNVSSFQRMIRAIPTIFAVRRETTAFCSATGPSL